MNKMQFQASHSPTLGVEIELALVDQETGALSSSIHDVIDNLPEEFAGRIKPELMQCYLEINTEVCETIDQAHEDLRTKTRFVEEATEKLGLGLYWSGTHPFSKWQDQIPTPDDRYLNLLENLQDMGRQLVTFGLHVHVGVESGDKSVMICDRILRHLPTLLALSANSPWWNDRVTGLQSHRAKVMEQLPTAGLPSFMRNWSEYVWLMNHLIDTGFIGSIRDIWWDVRPHHNFGTVEVRVCDMPGDLDSVCTVAAMIHCLVHQLSDEIDKGTYQHNCHPMIVRQNKWHASRYGLDAELIDSVTLARRPARAVVGDLTELLLPAARELNCESWLKRVPEMAAGGTWASKQLQVYEETKDMGEVVRRMREYSRLS